MEEAAPSTKEEVLEGFKSDSGKKWKIRVSGKTRKQKTLEEKKGKKGLRKKGTSEASDQRKKHKKGEAGTLVCFKVLKQNQYGKRQKRFFLHTHLLQLHSLLIL